MAHVKGLHETRGLTTLRVVGSGAGRGKLTAKLARLDHQRALLERQLAVWTEKQQVTKHRLDLLDEEITQIGLLLREFEGPYRSINQRKRARASGSEQQPDGGAAGVQRGNMSLEY
jgi:hypothetical protein